MEKKMQRGVARRGTRPHHLLPAAIVAACLSWLASSVHFVEAAAGLTAGYSFSEGAGTTTADASGSAINGVLVNNPTWVAGRNGGGLSFDGTTSYVDLFNPPALQISGSMTLSAWVYEFANVADDGQIIAKSDNTGWQLKSSPDTGSRTFAIAVTSSSGSVVQRYSSTVRALNIWYHVTGVYDASARSLNIYVNGALANGILSGTVPSSQWVSAVNANIGRRTGGFNINGIVDDVRVYARALTLPEIQADMATPIGGATGDGTPPSIPTGLTATAVSASQVNLGWTAATDNVAVAGYRIFRNGAQVGTGAATSFSDVDLVASTTYSYTVAAYDAAGNTSAQSTPAYATTQPPAFDFSLSNGGNRTVARGSSVTNTIAAALSSGAAQPVTYSVSGLPSGATGTFAPTICSPPCASTLTIATATSTPMGISTITVTGTAASLSRSTNFSLTVTSAGDTTPPTVSMTNPAAGATVRGTATTVSATAADNVGVAGVQFLLDGANLAAEDTSSPYSITWNTTTASSGQHALAARARDAAGNTTVSNVNVTVDNQPPTGSVSINGGVAATNSRTVTLTLAATDALSSVTQMRFSNNGSSYSAPQAYATTATWTLSSSAGTKTVYAQFKDAPGNWSAAITDTIVYDTTAPTISSVAASSITSSAARITWTTNESATSQVEYGTTTSYGTVTPLDPTLLASHSVVVSGLAPLTTYNYRVRSRDAAGNERISANDTFRTLASDSTPPSIPTNLSATPVSPTQVDLAWTPSTDNVGVSGYDVRRDAVVVGSPSTAAFADSGLNPATAYAYSVAARDAAGNVSPYTVAVTATTPALTISSVSAASITSTGAVINWSTDLPGTSQVEYGTSSAYGTLTSLDPGLTLAHAQTLSGLTSNTTYHFRVRSSDAGGNVETSGDFAFTTLQSGSPGTIQNEILLTDLNLPTALEFLPDGSLLILELGGRIRKVDTGNWTISPTPFLQLSNVGSTNGQQGLMDMALDPNFATNRHYYIFYTLSSPNRDRCSRFTATLDLSGTVPGSELVLYQDSSDADAEHHGGALNFGNDGKLYITTGEHFDPGVSQDLTSSRGKILRLDSDGTVPTDNPFYDASGPNYDAIWALGLRNPFRAWHDVLTGRLYVADVGGNDYATAQEEVNVAAAGANFGWPDCEGFDCGSNPAYESPLYAYAHQGRDASVTGGFVYHGSQFPAEYRGSYVFADYAQNWIKRLALDATGAVTGVFNVEPPEGTPDTPVGDIVFLAEGPDGAIYYLDLGYSDTTGEVGIGKLRRLRFISANQPPAVVATANPTEGSAPLAVAFSSAGTADPEDDPMTFSWTFGDGTPPSTDPNPVHTYTHNGPYTAILSVSDGTSSALAAPIPIQVGNKPVPIIIAPQEDSLFRAGVTIAFSGDATDPEDGNLAASAFTWSIDFLHEGHVHPALPLTGSKSGTFQIPTSGHDFSGHTRYRITLSVTDSDGLRASESVEIHPEKVDVAFDTIPSGLTLHLDGIPSATPFIHDSLIGFSHVIEAQDQVAGQSVYAFTSWSDGGTRQHTIVVPSSPGGQYVATYNVSQNPLPAGLAAGYGFSEGTGASTADVSGNGNLGSLDGGPIWATGRYGSGLTFTGSNYVDIGNGATLQLSGSMTLTAWVSISANPGDDGSIVAKLGSAGWQLKTSPDTGPRTAAIQISSNGSDAVQRHGATVLQTGVWYHLAGVYNAAARTLDIYVNGVIDNGPLTGTVPSSQYNAGFPVHIGQRPGLPGSFNFLGTLDEVHIFNRALTAAEILTDMNTPR